MLERQMTTRRNQKTPALPLLPILAGLVVLCLIIAAVLTALTRSASPVATPRGQFALVVQRIPFESQNALRGEPSAFDSLAKSAARLKSLRGSASGAGDAAAWSKL